MAHNAFNECTNLVPSAESDFFAGMFQPNPVNFVVENLIRDRFKNLPLHKLCYESSTTPMMLMQYLDNKPTEVTMTTDYLGMTPLHVLACNPRATVDMFKILLKHNPLLASMNTMVQIGSPLDLLMQLENVPLSIANDTSYQLKIQQQRGEINPQYFLKSQHFAGDDFHLEKVLLLNRSFVANNDALTQGNPLYLCPTLRAASNPEVRLQYVYILAQDCANFLLSLRRHYIRVEQKQKKEVLDDINCTDSVTILKQKYMMERICEKMRNFHHHYHVSCSHKKIFKRRKESSFQTRIEKHYDEQWIHHPTQFELFPNDLRSSVN